MGDRLGILSAVGYFFVSNENCPIHKGVRLGQVILKYEFPSSIPGLIAQLKLVVYVNFIPIKCLRPYHVEHTSSRPIPEVKQRRAELVLGWVTAWEYSVL